MSLNKLPTRKPLGLTSGDQIYKSRKCVVEAATLFRDFWIIFFQRCPKHFEGYSVSQNFIVWCALILCRDSRIAAAHIDSDYDYIQRTWKTCTRCSHLIFWLKDMCYICPNKRVHCSFCCVLSLATCCFLLPSCFLFFFTSLYGITRWALSWEQLAAPGTSLFFLRWFTLPLKPGQSVARMRNQRGRLRRKQREGERVTKPSHATGNY